VLLQKRETLQEISRQEPVAPVAGLTQPEMTVLALVAGGGTPDEWVSRYTVKAEAERDYLTPLGFGLALKRLLQKGFSRIRLWQRLLQQRLPCRKGHRFRMGLDRSERIAVRTPSRARAPEPSAAKR
jgi:hypothetical protein